MEIFEKPNVKREGFASLANFGYSMLEVSLDGEVYKYGIPSTTECCEAERVGNKWKIYTHDRSGNMIEQVMRVMREDVLVGCAWYNIDESLWENSTYADTIRRCKEFFSIPNGDIRETKYQTKNGFHYYVTKFGDVWNTETMTKVKGSISNHGCRHVTLGSVNQVTMHRLVAHHFVRVPKDLVDQGLKEDDLVVNHLDGNKLNNRSDNLKWVTYAGNMAHASSTGLLHITITDQLLEHVFKLLQEGYTDTAISKETGIPRRTVSNIRQGVSLRYRTDKYTWSKHSPGVRVLDKDTIFSIYDEFTYTNNSNCELSRKYNVSYQYIYYLRTGRSCSDLAREYITSKGLAGYWKGFSPAK